MPPSRCSACALDYQALALLATRSGLGGNITAEVAEYEAREVLFCRVGAEEVATSVAVDNNDCEISPTALGDPRLAAQRAEFDAD